jgi:hypothetical protein
MKTKNKPHPSRHELVRAHALLQTVAIHQVPINVLALVLGVARQSVYRQLQQARIELRRAADAARRARKMKGVVIENQEYLCPEDTEAEAK